MRRRPGKDVRIAVAGGQVAHGAHVAHQVRHQPLGILAGQMARHKPLLVALFVAAAHLCVDAGEHTVCAIRYERCVQSRCRCCVAVAVHF